MWYEILYQVLSIINYVVLAIIFIPLLIQILFVLFSWVKKKTYPKSDKKARIAYLIPACNEESVIYDTVKSALENQKYPKELFDVFVVADNCKDNTAKLAKEAGAIVLVHNDPDPAHHMALYPLKYGVDHPYSILGSIVQTGSDTTFYVVTLYFGSIKLQNNRYALKLGLWLDAIACLLAIIAFLIFIK